MNLLVDTQKALLWGQVILTDVLKSRKLAYLVLLAIIITLTVGLILFIIDPNIKSPIDGIWSAWVTMTHVGFGDVVPVSFFGRLLAAALILFGLLLFSLFTALVSVTLIDKHLDLSDETPLEPHQNRSQKTRDDLILAELAKLNQRMEQLELQLSQHNKHPVESSQIRI